MSQYSKIISAFETLGYSQISLLQQFQVKRALDQLSTSQGGSSEFDRGVIQQLWEHTPKQREDFVVLRQLVQSIAKAQNVIQQHIHIIEQKLKYTDNADDRQKLQSDLLCFRKDQSIISQPFELPKVSKSQTIFEPSAKLTAATRMSGQKIIDEKIGTPNSHISTLDSSNKKQSWSLKIVLLITMVLFGLELVIMFHKNHFLNLITYVMILMIYLQNYFDRLYMRIIICCLGLTIILDFIWLAVHAENWWHPYPQTQHSTLQTVYLRISYFLVIITVLTKILVFALFFKYFNIESQVKKSVRLISISFDLYSGSQTNPFTQAINQAINPQAIVQQVEQAELIEENNILW